MKVKELIKELEAINPELPVRIWYDSNIRDDVNYAYVAVDDRERVCVLSEEPYKGKTEPIITQTDYNNLIENFGKLSMPYDSEDKE